MKQYNFVKGKINEDKAVVYVTKVKNFKIIERNYSTKIGEIDIIAKDKDTICFIEVKYRTTAKYGLGREAVNPYKINKIKNTAMQYLLSLKNTNQKVRFDVIDILGDKLDYIENAF